MYGECLRALAAIKARAALGAAPGVHAHEVEQKILPSMPHRTVTGFGRTIPAVRTVRRTVCGGWLQHEPPEALSAAAPPTVCGTRPRQSRIDRSQHVRVAG